MLKMSFVATRSIMLILSAVIVIATSIYIYGLAVQSSLSNRSYQISSLDLSLVSMTNQFDGGSTRLREGRRNLVLVDDFFVINVERDFLLRVPKNFNTDFASIPYPFSAWISQFGSHAEAAVVHDWLYAVGEPGQRREADQIFFEMMRQADVNLIQSTAMYIAVRAFGNRSYGQRIEWAERFFEPISSVRIPEYCIIPKPQSGYLVLSDILVSGVEDVRTELNPAFFGPYQQTRRMDDLRYYFGSDIEWSNALDRPICSRFFYFVMEEQYLYGINETVFLPDLEIIAQPYIDSYFENCSSLKAAFAQMGVFQTLERQGQSGLELLLYGHREEIFENLIKCDREHILDFITRGSSASEFSVNSFNRLNDTHAANILAILDESISLSERSQIILSSYPELLYITTELESRPEELVGILGFFLVFAQANFLQEYELAWFQERSGELGEVLRYAIDSGATEWSEESEFQTIMGQYERGRSEAIFSLLTSELDESASEDFVEFQAGMAIIAGFGKNQAILRHLRIFAGVIAACEPQRDLFSDQLRQYSFQRFDGEIDFQETLDDAFSARRILDTDGDLSELHPIIPGAAWIAAEANDLRQERCD